MNNNNTTDFGNTSSINTFDKVGAHIKLMPDVLQQRQKNDDMSTTTNKPKNGQKVDIATKATERVIQLIENGNPMWRRTWGTYGLAKNFVSGNYYQGVNFLFLNMIAPYPIPYYLSFRDIKNLKGKLKKGSKAEWVYYYKKYYKDENGNTLSDADAKQKRANNEEVKTIKFLKTYPVYNIECTEGIEWERPPEVERDNNSIHECESILEEMKDKPTFELTDANSAFYDPLVDIVNVPDIKQFENSEFFYRTTFHELGHWTGHKDRLARKGIVNCIERNKAEYAEEELVAELSSNIIMNLVGISNEETENVSAGYLKHWVKQLREDPKFLFRIAPKAQKATEYILGKPLIEIYAKQ